jgi:hypothetical protein
MVVFDSLAAVVEHLGTACLVLLHSLMLLLIV